MIDERREAQASLYVLEALPPDELAEFEAAMRGDHVDVFAADLAAVEIEVDHPLGTQRAFRSQRALRGCAAASGHRRHAGTLCIAGRCGTGRFARTGASGLGIAAALARAAAQQQQRRQGRDEDTGCDGLVWLQGGLLSPRTHAAIMTPCFSH